MRDNLPMIRIALNTGVNGQAGAYLSELLRAKAHDLHGVKRGASLFNIDCTDHPYQDPHLDHQPFKLHCGDRSDSANLTREITRAIAHTALSLQDCLVPGQPERAAPAGEGNGRSRLRRRAARRPGQARRLPGLRLQGICGSSLYPWS